MIVLLKDGTVGTVYTAEIGDTVTVSLHDENGCQIKVQGVVVAILDRED